MLAAVWGEGKLTLKEIQMPVLEKNDDVIVKVAACGICGTDLHIIKSDFVFKPNTVLGHEIAGTVIDIGSSVKNLKIGDNVVIEPNKYCDNCHFCKMNLKNLCDNWLPNAMGLNIDGGFAEYCKTSEKFCHKVTSTVSLDILSLAEVLADVLNGTQKIKPQLWESAVIIGGGPIGMVFLRVFKISGVSKIILSEPSSYRRKIAKDLGADIVVNPLDADLNDIVRREIKIGVDIVVDAVGDLLEEGIKVVRKGGRLLLIGVNAKHIAKVPQADIVNNEIQIFGSVIANSYFPRAISLIESGVLGLEKIVTHKFTLKNIHEALKLFSEGKALKIVINP